MENKIDKLFREKLGDVPAFDPAAWDRMDQLLQEDRRTRRSGYWRPMFLLGLLAFIVGTGVICLQGDDEIADPMVSDAFAVTSESDDPQTSVAARDIATRGYSSKYLTTDALNTKGRDTETTIPSPQKEETNNETAKSKSLASDLHVDRDDMSSSQSHEFNEIHTENRSGNKRLEVRNQTDLTNVLVVSSELNSKSTRAASERIKNANKGNVSESSTARDQTTTRPPVHLTPSTDWEGDNTISLENTDSPSINNAVQAATKREIAVNDGLSLETKDSEASESANGYSEVRAPISTLPISEEVAVLLHKAPIAVPSIQIITKSALRVSLSTMVGYGNGTISTAGFLVQQDINRLWSTGAGLAMGYRSFGYPNDLIVRDKRYSFGSTLSERTLSISGVGFVEIPIYLQRRMGRLDIRIGLSPSYQALTRGAESRAGEILRPAEWYDVDDVRSVQVNYQFGVGYRFYRRLSVTAELGYRSSIFKSGSVDYSDGGIVTSIRLSYDIFKL